MTDRKRNLSCSYCGLPLAAGWWFRRGSVATSPQPAAPVYCCSGCRFAAEVTAESRAGTSINKPVARLGIAIFLTVNVVMFTMVLWSNDVYPLDLEKGTVSRSIAKQTLRGELLDDAFRWLSLLLSAGVVWLLAGPLAQNAWQEMRRGVAAVDMLLLVGILAAFVYSIVSVIRGEGHIYFEVTCVVLVLVTLGRWLESLGKMRAAGAIESLTKLLPREVQRLGGGREETVRPEQLRRRDRIRIRPGERIAADGHVVEGVSDIDEQLLTGESRCVLKRPGDAVLGGTLNLDGSLIIEVDCDGGQGTVERMVESLRQAQLVRGRYQRLADRIAKWFLPATMTIALGTLVWHTQHTGLESGLLAAMAVLLIACPCALGLATPLAVWTALGQASKHQVLVRHGDALERLAAAKIMLFDKTGTLSSGDANVAQLFVADELDRDDVLRHAVALASASTHPYSAAVLRFSTSRQAQHENGHDGMSFVQCQAGKGMTAFDTALGCQVALGSQSLMQELGFAMPGTLQAEIDRFDVQSASWVMIGWEQLIRGVFVLDEQIRPAARQTLAELRSLAVKVAVLTGDRQARAVAFARLLEVEVQGGLLPEDKVAAVNGARHQHGAVAMVGDGLNDATALAAADVGIAMGYGADVSREAADLCLLGNDLSRLPWIVGLARQTVRVIRQNLFWSLAYNTLGIGLAISGRLNPIWAAGAMMLSSFFVIANSLRIGVPTPGSVSENRRSADTGVAELSAGPIAELPKASAIRCLESPTEEFVET